MKQNLYPIIDTDSQTAQRLQLHLFPVVPDTDVRTPDSRPVRSPAGVHMVDDDIWQAADDVRALSQMPSWLSDLAGESTREAARRHWSMHLEPDYTELKRQMAGNMQRVADRHGFQGHTLDELRSLSAGTSPYPDRDGGVVPLRIRQVAGAMLRDIDSLNGDLHRRSCRLLAEGEVCALALQREWADGMKRRLADVTHAQLYTDPSGRDWLRCRIGGRQMLGVPVTRAERDSATSREALDSLVARHYRRVLMPGSDDMRRSLGR